MRIRKPIRRMLCEDEKQAFFCERKEGKEDVEEGHIDWRYSNLDDIINIKMKGE